MSLFKESIAALLTIVALLILLVSFSIQFIGVLFIIPVMWDRKERAYEGLSKWGYAKGIIFSNVSSANPIYELYREIKK